MTDLQANQAEGTAMDFHQHLATGWRRRGKRALIVASAATVFASVLLWLTALQADAYTGINSFSTAQSDTQAGGHPDVEIHTTFDNRVWENGELKPPLPGGCECEDAQNIDIQFPPGFIGDPHAVPKCTLSLFSTQSCAPESQVGVLSVGYFFGYTPIYNMVPHEGEPGLLAFYVPVVETPAYIVLHARTGSDYGLNATNSGIYHPIPIQELHVYMWGVPALSAHDKFRFPIHQQRCFGVSYPEPCYTPVASNSPSTPFLDNPTTCGTDLTSQLEIDYYDGTREHAEAPWSKTTGCDQLSFDPSLSAEPTTTVTDTASGLDVDLKVPQNQSAFVPSPSQIRSTTVTLPEGMSINPSGADGKVACSDSEGSFGTELPANCPEYAKIGTLQVDSSALPGPIDGAIYLGQPLAGDAYRVFLTASGYATHVKLAGSARPDPGTGQLVVTFPNLPQSPLQRFTMHFFGSERGLLATPERCGTYPVRSTFLPWNSFLPEQESVTFFKIDSGPNGSPCPGAQRRFQPQLKAGTADNTAGVHSPFSMKLGRDDGDQNLTAAHVSTPPGFSATLAGIPYCPETSIYGPGAVTDPDRTGAAELASPACPAGSRIGEVIPAAGAGSHPFYTQGSVYLAGPYKGSDLSLLLVTPAVAGPYDLGSIVVRVQVYIDPVTAQITAISDPIPQIVEGIPLRLRSVLLTLDRPGFTLNPTNCDPFAVAVTAVGDEGAVAVPTQAFQVGNCNALGFAPRIGLSLRGNTKRRGHPSLHTLLRRGAQEANLSRIVVAMPSNELLDNAHIDTICTRVQFASDTCPEGSVIGTASVDTPILDQPLSGPVLLRSSSRKLPDLVIALRGRFDIELVGHIDSSEQEGLRATFEKLPDAPFTTAVVDLQGGKKGLLQNSKDLCKAGEKATVTLVGQNGRRFAQRVKLTSACGGEPRRKRHHRDGRTAHTPRTKKAA